MALNAVEIVPSSGEIASSSAKLEIMLRCSEMAQTCVGASLCLHASRKTLGNDEPTTAAYMGRRL